MHYRKLIDVADILNGYAFKSKEYVEQGIRIIRIANVQDGCIVDEQPCFYPMDSKKSIEKYMLSNNDLLISLTGNVGRVGVLNEEMLPAALNQRVGCIRIKNRKVLKLKYLFYFLRRKQFIEDAIKASRGVAQLNLSTKWLETYLIPVPSLDEQQRIVAKIEELFSNLDASVAELETAKEKLKVYRQAVLKEAFEGIKNYSITTISEVCSEIKVGIVIKPTQYYVDTNGICAFRNANVRRNHIQDENWVMISEEGHIKNQKSIVHANDVLIARSGVNLGMAAVVSTKYDGFNAIDIVIAVPIDKMVKSDYLSYYTNSPLGIEKIKAKQRGVAQGHLNVNEYSQISLILPSLKEQEKIVQEIESRLSVCDNIETTIDTALQQAEVLRQSILKQAFEGKLI